MDNDPYLNHFTQPDSIIPNPGNVLDWNRYSYARYNPLRYADPSGHWVDAVIDGDIYDISQNGLNWENGLALTADVVGAVIPIATGLGLGMRAAFQAARAADKAADVAKVVNAVDNVVDTANAIENAIDVASAGDNLADALKAADNIPCSFSAETSVSTNEGAVTIAAIEIGDYVLGWNEADGTLGYYPVTAVLIHDDLALTEVIIDGEWLETTPEHPFYTKDDGWLPAGELKTGMKVRKADGSYGLV